MILRIDSHELTLATLQAVAFQKTPLKQIEFAPECLERVESSHRALLNLIEKNIPVYGVTTGYGDSCHRTIAREKSAQLQHNLIAYLCCGTGRDLSIPATRAMCLVRLKSLSRGYSGVSADLLHRLATLLTHDILPVVPVEGSLGASGDLIPLAYLGALLQGQGQAWTGGVKVEAAVALQRIGLAPYEFKPKEGLAIVNGTSTMAGLAFENLCYARYLCEVATIATSWLCMSLGGKTEAFGEIVNERTKNFVGQSRIAAKIRALLAEEKYTPLAGQNVRVHGRQTDGYVQDRYSLRCTPQILGPVDESIGLASEWLLREINSTSDNPLIDPESGDLAMGGNFYGGYIAHGMDYLKMCLGHIADLQDRQLMTLIDDKSNRGLTPNLANWPGLAEDEQHLHHGLKGLHQAVNAITSEILAGTNPSSVHSRSSELHNQDKVSLGMSAAVSCAALLEKSFNINALYLVCLAQALDLRKIKLKGKTSRNLYEMVRSCVGFVDRDRALGADIQRLREKLLAAAQDTNEDMTR